MKIIGIIPARYASSRFPGKPLVDIKGKTMIQRVYEQVLKATTLTDVLVATDDQRIYDHVQSFGGQVTMTKSTHESGTERCAEVAAQYPADIVINIQGDEPFIQPIQIDMVANLLKKTPTLSIATLAKKITTTKDLFNPNLVKVIFNQHQKAIYFSRQAIPYIRDAIKNNWLEQFTYYKHIGLYGYRGQTLIEIAQLPPSSLEQVERLEQLRWLENDYAIGVGITTIESIGIDTPEDLERIKLHFL